MKKRNNRIIKYNVITAVITIIILICSVMISVIRYQNLDYNNYSNTIRENLNPERVQINHILQSNKDNYPLSQYPYLVVDLKGIVKYADSKWNISKDEQLPLEELLQQDKSFSYQYPNQSKCYFTLTDLKNETDTCIGFVVYMIPDHLIKDRIYHENFNILFLPIMIGIAVSILLIIIRTIYCNRRMVRPLQAIYESANAIIAGNYDVEVQRVLETQLQSNEIGNLIYSFELMRDELKAKQQRENELKQSQQELISCISHDLRTPISTIKAYGEGLRDGIAADPEEVQNYLKIIIDKTSLLERMIKELLTYSNTQLNKMEILKKDIYLNDYLKDLCRELKVYVTQQGIEFNSHLTDQNVLVRIDTRRMTEVFYNLIENSMKYIGDGHGEISIKTMIKSDMVEIHVKDNGIGISAADIPYVFDKFYRAEKSRSSNISGSGLGLSICRYIVNQHGGEIYCQSRKSSGSDFWFTLPL